MFGGKPCAGLVSMNLGDLELVEVIGNNNKEEEDAKLNITFSCDVINDECQTLEELEAHKNNHLVEVGPKKAVNSCSL